MADLPFKIMSMMSFNDVKKRIKVGTKLHTIWHRKIVGRHETTNAPIYGDDDLGVREVVTRQTNAFACKTERKNGEIVNSWLQFPKASEVKIIDNDTFEIYETGDNGELIKFLTYKFVD